MSWSRVVPAVGDDGQSRVLPSRVHAIVLVSKLHKPTLRALAQQRTLVAVPCLLTDAAGRLLAAVGGGARQPGPEPDRHTDRRGRPDGRTAGPPRHGLPAGDGDADAARDAYIEVVAGGMPAVIERGQELELDALFF